MAGNIRRGTGLSGSDGLGLHVVPSWIDVDHVRPISKEDNWFAQQHNQIDKLTVLYSGNMGMARNLDIVIQVAERMSEDSRIGFLLIGDGPQRKGLQQTVVHKELSNITILPWQSKKDLPYSLATGDVAIVSLNREAAGIAMPSKTYSMMAAGCALITLSDGQNDLADTVERHACGINVGCNDIDGLEVALHRFLDKPDFLSACRHNARQAAEAFFSTQACLEKYGQILHPLVDGASVKVKRKIAG
jgi:glycosyltransferase involved in cell wall biosynthesis